MGESATPLCLFRPNMDYDFCLGCDTQTTGSNYCSESCRQAELEKHQAPTQRSYTTSYNKAWSSLTLPAGQNLASADVRSSALAEENLRAYNKMLKDGIESKGIMLGDGLYNCGEVQ